MKPFSKGLTLCPFLKKEQKSFLFLFKPGPSLAKEGGWHSQKASLVRREAISILTQQTCDYFIFLS